MGKVLQTIAAEVAIRFAYSRLVDADMNSIFGSEVMAQCTPKDEEILALGLEAAKRTMLAKFRFLAHELRNPLERQ